MNSSYRKQLGPFSLVRELKTNTRMKEISDPTRKLKRQHKPNIRKKYKVAEIYLLLLEVYGRDPCSSSTKRLASTYGWVPEAVVACWTEGASEVVP